MTTPTEPLVTVSIDGPIATMRLNRPASRNAISVELLEAMHARMDELEPLCGTADGVRVAVITGTGKAFCAGMDLKQVIIDADAGGSGDPDLPLRLLSELARFTHRVRTLPAVTVAAVNGPAVGGGCGMVCVCDVSISHAGVKLGFPEVDLGICPAVIAPWVIKKLGAGVARRALLSGGVMSGAEAHAIGLLDYLADDLESMDTLVRETAARLAEGGAKALAATKDLLNELDGSMDEEVLKRAAALSATVLATPEAQAKLIERLK